MEAMAQPQRNFRERDRKKGELMMESPRCEIYARHKKYEDS